MHSQVFKIQIGGGGTLEKNDTLADACHTLYPSFKTLASLLKSKFVSLSDPSFYDVFTPRSAAPVGLPPSSKEDCKAWLHLTPQSCFLTWCLTDGRPKWQCQDFSRFHYRNIKYVPATDSKHGFNASLLLARWSHLPVIFTSCRRWHQKTKEPMAYAELCF